MPSTSSTASVSRGTKATPPATKPGGLKGALTKKAGPLPVWVWGAGGLVIVAAFLYFRSKAGSSTTTGGAGTPQTPQGQQQGGGGGGGAGATSTGGGGGGGTAQDFSPGGGGGGGTPTGGPSSTTSTSLNGPEPAPAKHVTAYGLKPGTVVTPELPSGAGKVAVTTAAQTAEPTATGYGAPQVRAISPQMSSSHAAQKSKTPAKTTTAPAGFTAPKTEAKPAGVRAL
jgi:hypothetical protein